MEESHLPTRYRTSWVAIQRNPIAGRGKRDVELLKLCRELKKRGFAPRMFSNREQLAGILQNETAKQNLKCLIVAGGDGTVSDAIRRYPGVPLTVLAMGTENLFARHLGLPKAGRQLAELVAEGHYRRIDVGTINEFKFTVMASIGFDAEVIHRFHAMRKGHITRLNYLKPIWKALNNYRHPEMKIFVDGDSEPKVAGFLIASNLPRYAIRLKVATSARDDDGLLHITLFRKSSYWRLFVFLFYARLGLLHRLQSVEQLTCRRLRVESETQIPLQADGDPTGLTPADIEICPSSLNVLEPATGR